MLTPGFRYARSPDGTSIAYARFGSGPALVVVPPVPFSNVSGELEVPLMQEVYRSLASHFEVILYDGRGTGASQRTVTDVSTDALAMDLTAVIDDTGLGEVALLAMYLAAAPTLTYAARQPDRVTHVAVFGALVTGSQAIQRPGTAALLGLIDQDWELFTKTAALDWMGWGAGDSGGLVARAFRATTTPGIAKATLAAYAESDVGPLLADITAPTLVMHRRDGQQVRLEQSSELAARLPNGRLHVLDGDSATLWFDDPMGTVGLVTDFIRPGRHVHTAAPVDPAQASLTARESEVLVLIAAGESNQAIAASLGLSIHTVERHAANIYRKIDARGRADATAWALRNRLS
jgi:DNA-binding CsgD family transcriptional regulator/pimeloyl-ACP methyl ester carboxylesterase